MLDVKKIRNQFEEVSRLLKQRGVEQEQLDNFLKLDKKRRELLPQVEEKKKTRNTLSEKVANLKKNNQDAKENIEKNKKLNIEITTIEQKLDQVNEQLNEILVRLPNLPHDSVPFGEDEGENVEIRRWEEHPVFNFEPLNHWEIGEKLDILDFERASKVTGSRFVYYKNWGARLERAVYNFMLDVHVNEDSYEEMITPYIVNSKSMFGTGQFPKFKEDVFQLKDSNYTLIPTAEVTLTNYYSNEILNENDLPIYMTALSPCFRSEAGSAGRDTRGLIRMHQFHKVEMVKYATEDTSYEELEKLTRNGEDILKKLDLPYRTITLCTGDMGFSAAKTYDIEVWMPAQKTYREISSCSNCTDFQARRAKIRYRNKNGKIKFAHTLNGSGLAVGRTVAAILENYQNEDGSVTIPEVLRPYMNGAAVIPN
ncbi:MAG: serine--tRNA ligase [Tetragenococcus halophilus]|uniref:Serine--tRNA ligase n=1 Tax=Tetragenococcus halophilus (strain DSM 20338 / JCM 20259 / NCIMB 9735 / NBRC 12172) TaxID=945021 RepID=A0AAN1SEF3_TETHN|nr:serine--tRNA ligase [Tetragenococcus halophilus]MDN6497481.1 serine--tRNA ligase [Tetragenococcus koreensis]MDN5831964.1 serine--tRNA ligase [Tetragenococcus halophilus]MDN6113198.1 serine--tRNA ligase [Tetragenococcus halophilus]MDN6141450.1 serine--tRNA ligase [Tetragenococcus halophilus]MDN6143048.1 serine--tRNA ligase [Tetragenococcus halophilus]